MRFVGAFLTFIIEKCGQFSVISFAANHISNHIIKEHK